eukprot:gene23738-biopygen5855
MQLATWHLPSHPAIKSLRNMTQGCAQGRRSVGPNYNLQFDRVSWNYRVSKRGARRDPATISRRFRGIPAFQRGAMRDPATIDAGFAAFQRGVPCGTQLQFARVPWKPVARPNYNLTREIVQIPHELARNATTLSRNFTKLRGIHTNPAEIREIPRNTPKLTYVIFHDITQGSQDSGAGVARAWCGRGAGIKIATSLTGCGIGCQYGAGGRSLTGCGTGCQQMYNLVVFK